MKIDTNENGDTTITEAFNGVGFSHCGDFASISNRDNGFEILYHGTLIELKNGVITVHDIVNNLKSDYDNNKESLEEEYLCLYREFLELNTNLLGEYIDDLVWDRKKIIKDKGFSDCELAAKKEYLEKKMKAKNEEDR